MLVDISVSSLLVFHEHVKFMVDGSFELLLIIDELDNLVTGVFEHLNCHIIVA